MIYSGPTAHDGDSVYISGSFIRRRRDLLGTEDKSKTKDERTTPAAGET